MSQASPRMQAMTKEYVGLRSAIPAKSKKPPAYMGWRTYAYNPCLTRVSFTDGMCVRKPRKHKAGKPERDAGKISQNHSCHLSTLLAPPAGKDSCKCTGADKRKPCYYEKYYCPHTCRA